MFYNTYNLSQRLFFHVICALFCESRKQLRLNTRLREHCVHSTYQLLPALLEILGMRPRIPLIQQKPAYFFREYSSVSFHSILVLTSGFCILYFSFPRVQHRNLRFSLRTNPAECYFRRPCLEYDEEQILVLGQLDVLPQVFSRVHISIGTLLNHRRMTKCRISTTPSTSTKRWDQSHSGPRQGNRREVRTIPIDKFSCDIFSSRLHYQREPIVATIFWNSRKKLFTVSPSLPPCLRVVKFRS